MITKDQSQKSYRLTSTDQKILYCVQLNADLDVPTLAKMTSLRPHVIQYALCQLHHRGIVRWVPYVDIYRLGYYYTMILFSVAANERQRIQLVERANRIPGCTWLAELGGRYHYGLTFATRTPGEAAQCFTELLEPLRVRLIDRAIAVRTKMTDLNRGYLAADIKIRPSGSRHRQFWDQRHLEPIQEPVIVSAGELAVLESLAQVPFTSFRSAALSSGTPISTFEARLNSLRHKKIFNGGIYQLYPQKIGREAYKLILRVQQPTSGLYHKLLAHVATIPQSYHFVEAFGDWDYELNVEIEKLSDLTAITQDIYARFFGEVRAIESCAIGETYKFSRFPGRAPI